MFWTAGIDPGTVRCGIGMTNGETLRLSVINFSIHVDEDGHEHRFDLVPADYCRVLDKFITEQHSVFSQIARLGIERQRMLNEKRKKGQEKREETMFIEFSRCFEAILRGRFPQMDVYITDPHEVRQFFNISVMKPLITRLKLNMVDQYELRKTLSEAVLPKVFAPELARRFLGVFDGCNRDAIEAGLIALFCHFNPRTPPPLLTRPVDRNEQFMRVFTAPLFTKEPRAFMLSPAERGMVVFKRQNGDIVRLGDVKTRKRQREA